MASFGTNWFYVHCWNVHILLLCQIVYDCELKKLNSEKIMFKRMLLDRCGEQQRTDIGKSQQWKGKEGIFNTYVISCSWKSIIPFSFTQWDNFLSLFSQSFQDENNWRFFIQNSRLCRCKQQNLSTWHPTSLIEVQVFLVTWQ